MGGTAYITIVRRDHDFRVVDCSTPFPYKNALKEEARWLALEWWGNCFVESFRGAVGHFCSSVESGFHLLLLVQRGPVAPDRFVVYMREEDYAPFGFDPFRAMQGGAFSHLTPFYAQRGEHQYAIDWRAEIEGLINGPATAEFAGRYELARRHLEQGTSIVIPTEADNRPLESAIVKFAFKQDPSLLKKINICTFTNAAPQTIGHFGTIICGMYNANRQDTFAGVVDKLVPLDENGSPFQVIRR
jgi:hypothetical protein